MMVSQHIHTQYNKPIRCLYVNMPHILVNCLQNVHTWDSTLWLQGGIPNYELAEIIVDIYYINIPVSSMEYVSIQAEIHDVWTWQNFVKSKVSLFLSQSIALFILSVGVALTDAKVLVKSAGRHKFYCYPSVCLEAKSCQCTSIEKYINLPITK